MSKEALVPIETPKPTGIHKEENSIRIANEFKKKSSRTTLTNLTANSPESVKKYGIKHSTPILEHYKRNDRAGLAKYLDSTAALPEVRNFFLGSFDTQREQTVKQNGENLKLIAAEDVAKCRMKKDKQGEATVKIALQELSKQGWLIYNENEFNNLVQQKVKELSMNEFTTRQSTSIDPIARQAATLAQLDALQKTVNDAIASIRIGLSEEDNERLAYKESWEESKAKKKREEGNA